MFSGGTEREQWYEMDYVAVETSIAKFRDSKIANKLYGSVNQQ